MPEISFQVNEFRTYEVRVEGVSFGFIATDAGAYAPALGETFEYDGNTVILKDGREFSNVPQLRSAIGEGWCLPVGEKVTARRPRSAQIQVRATTHAGSGRVVKSVPQMERAEEDVVVTVDDRRRRREAVNSEATRRVPMQSDEGRAAMAERWDSGDDVVNEIADLLSDEMDAWLAAQEEDEDVFSEVLEDEEEIVKARAEADILSLFALVEDDEEEALRARSQARRAKKAASRSAARSPRVRPPASALPASVPSDLRTLPVDVPEGERMSMPLVREDVMENAGSVVGSVVEREREIELDVAPARPHQAPRPSPRLGGTGAIVVDEQRHMGDIALSGGRAPIHLEESAQVKPASTESIKMGEVQVGDRRKVARAVVETDQGVAVGRILSPTRRDFVADDRNTSTSAIERASEGRQVRIEKFEVEADEMDARDARAPSAVATGDVQEARTGDDLEELLPDAARGPRPVVHRRPEEDPAYAAVKMMIPDFEWNKDRQVKERVAEALKHYKNPMYLKGILAVETEVAREAIKKGLADLLAKQKKGKKGGKKAAAQSQ